MADGTGRAFPLRGPLPFSGANASRHHLPRSIADKHLYFNHYDPSHNLLGKVTLPTGTSEPSRRGEGGLRTVFDTATMPTGTSVASLRGKAFFWTVFGTATMPTSTTEPSLRGKGGFYQHFGTGTPSTGTSGAGSRGEGKEIGTVDGIKVGFTTWFFTTTLPTDASVPSLRGEEGIYRHFGTGTLPTDASVASSRNHCELVYRIVALLGFVKFTWYEPLLIIK